MAKKLKLAVKIKALNDVPEHLHDFYEENDDGEFELIVDGAPKKSEEDEEADKGSRKKLSADLDRYRSEAKKLEREKAALLGTLKGFGELTPERAAELSELETNLGKAEEGELIKKGDWDGVLNKRTKAMRDNLDAKLAAEATGRKKAEETANSYRTKYRDMLIDQRLTSAITDKAQPKEKALVNILKIVKSDWTTDDEDNLVPARDDIMNEKGEKASVEDYVTMFVNTNSYLFEQGTGGGATGSGAQRKKEVVRTVSTNDPNKGNFLHDIAAGKVKVRQE